MACEKDQSTFRWKLDEAVSCAGPGAAEGAAGACERTSQCGEHECQEGSADASFLQRWITMIVRAALNRGLHGGLYDGIGQAMDSCQSFGPELQREMCDLYKALVEQGFSSDFALEASNLMPYAREHGLRFVLPDRSALEAIDVFKRWYEKPLLQLANVERVKDEELAKVDAFLAATKDGGDEAGGDALEHLQSLRLHDLLEDELKPILAILEEMAAVSGLPPGTGQSGREAPIQLDLPEQSTETGRSGMPSSPETLMQPTTPLRPSRPDILEKLRLACEEFKVVLRYTIEEVAQFYHGGRFTVEYLTQVLGWLDDAGAADVVGLLLKEDGSQRTIADFGCGDGDLLRQLLKAVRVILKGEKYFYEYLRLLGEADDSIDISINTPENLVRRLLFSKLQRAGLNFKSDTDSPNPHLIGVDRARGTDERLAHPGFGVTGVVADVCDPTLIEKLGRGKVDIVFSTLTTDRIPDNDAMLENAFEVLAEGGQLMIATKGIIDPVSDGEGAKKPIQYSPHNDLKGSSYAETVEKLTAKLRQHGFEVETISVHPYCVTCTDGLQYYNLLVVVARKVRKKISKSY